MAYNHRKYNDQKSAKLGMDMSQARNLLKKQVYLMLIRKSGLDTCYRCGDRLIDINDISIEHTTDYNRSADPLKEFFDLSTIAFSHKDCNTQARNPLPIEGTKHGTNHAYNQGCRCTECRECHKLFMREARKRARKRNLLENFLKKSI